MSIVSSVATVSLLVTALVASTQAADAGESSNPPCSTLTVTISHVADIPSGLSIRALQEGLNYPPRCR